MLGSAGVRKLGTDVVQPLAPETARHAASASSVGTWLKDAFRGAPTLSLVVLTLAIICALFAPWIAPADPIVGNLAEALQPPGSSDHVLGTDNQGRDLLSRIIYGARISVTVGILAVFVAGGVGTIIAVLSAVYTDWVEVALMRLTDAFLALPFLMVSVTVVSLLGASMLNVILVIGLLRWMGYARVLRGEVLRLMEMDFVRLALVAGAGRWSIIWRHILPNLINTLLVLGTLELGVAVIAEAGLSFLGLGVPRPLPSWGTMLAESQQYFYVAWWLPVIPGIAITLLVMSSNLTGDWLRDRTDPTRRQL
jgi:peptide/nickel transport system permease protein